LTKADKISNGKGNAVLQQVEKHLTGLSGDISVQLFSALKRIGVGEVHKKLDFWLN